MLLVDGGKDHTIDSRHCRNKDGVDVVVRKKKGVCRVKAIVVNVPTDSDVRVVVSDAVSDGKSIAKGRSSFRLDTEAPVFARSHLSQATDDIEVAGQGKSGVVEKPFGANVADELTNPVPNEKTEDAAWTRASLVHSPGAEEADLVAFYAHIQELYDGNKDLLARRTEILKIQMDTVLKLCSEKKKSGALESKLKRLTEQLAELRAAQERGAIDRQATEDAVAA